MDLWGSQMMQSITMLSVMSCVDRVLTDHNLIFKGLHRYSSLYTNVRYPRYARLERMKEFFHKNVRALTILGLW